MLNNAPASTYHSLELLVWIHSDWQLQRGNTTMSNFISKLVLWVLQSEHVRLAL